MKHKSPNLLKPLGTIIHQNSQFYYPSEPFSFHHFNVRHPVSNSSQRIPPNKILPKNRPKKVLSKKSSPKNPPKKYLSKISSKKILPKNPTKNPKNSILINLFFWLLKLYLVLSFLVILIFLIISFFIKVAYNTVFDCAVFNLFQSILFYHVF